MNTLAQALPKALIAGCGDIGVRVARRLAGSGGEVTGILRDPQKRAVLESAGAQVRIEDLDQAGDAGDWPWLFWFAPPPDSGAADTRLRRWLTAQRGRIGRLVYISTSGVYGDCDGRWIAEDEPLKPQTERARRRCDAEAALADWAGRSGTACVILRVPGIYGPGRLPVERLRKGLAVLRDEDAPYSNRIHADDLAECAVLAAARGCAGAAYNVSDGHPTTMSDYFRRCARLLGLPPPEALGRDDAQRRLSPAMWSFMEESKRLKIERAVRELGFAPRYPDLEHGLPSCVDP
ncbi:MAG: SDR family oxidoreductase [Sinimarinibacterium sp.]|jgi:nucleoside-diphosphate-sugar epimerase